MPCGLQLIEAVAGSLSETVGKTSTQVSRDVVGTSQRCIRYAIAELIKQGRAKRKGQQGPVYAVREEA